MTEDSGWDRRVSRLSDRHRREVASSFEDPPTHRVAASVVIVTYRSTREELEALVDGLAGQSADEFETIVVDNGCDWPVDRLVRDLDSFSAYVKLRRNCGVTVARNVGARIAASDVVVFLDDDAVPDRDFVDAHLRLQGGDVVGVRGRVATTEDTFYNRYQWWYDLGDEPKPYHLNTEGSSSYDREAFLSVGGFDEGLASRAGHEGTDLTYRLVDSGGYDRDQFIYHPAPVVYHDMDSDPVSYLKKRTTRRYHRKRLLDRRPGLAEFARSYDDPEADLAVESYRDRLLAMAFRGLSRLGCRLITLKRGVFMRLPLGNGATE